MSAVTAVRRPIASPSAFANRGVRPSSKWTLAFLIVPIACQLLLLVPALAQARIFLRTAAFANGLAYLFLLPGDARRHPSSKLMVGALLVVGLEFLNPTTNSALSGVAHLFFYLAIASPLFWVPRMAITVGDFERMITFIWGFATLSAVFGALQVYFPGRFQPQTSTVLGEMTRTALNITLADGSTVPRPMGLTDTPGGAAVAGFQAAILGLGLSLEAKPLKRLALLTSVGLGAFVIYLSQIRSLFVLVVVCVLVMSIALTMQGRIGRASSIAVLVFVLGAAAFVLAVSVGGEAVASRLGSLGEDDLSTVYQKNRGHFLVQAFTELLPLYPLGAGLGRWGMIAGYFGDLTNRDALPLWVEIQWSGWVVDGGIPLLILYSMAVLTATTLVFRVTTTKLALPWRRLQSWGVVLLGYNVALIANTFSYPVFASQTGQEFWLLNAAFFAAVCTIQADKPA